MLWKVLPVKFSSVFSCNPGYLVGWWSVSLLDFCNSVACISFSVCSEDMANIVVNTEDQAEVVDEVL